VIIAIAGPHGSGKDTVASFLKPYGFNRLSYADEVCRCVSHKYKLPYARLLGLNQEDRLWRSTPHPSLAVHKGTRLTPLDVLNIEGDGSREVQPDVWVNHLLDIIDKDTQSNWVIPGTRRLNEAQAVLARGGLLWYVYKQGLPLGPEEKELPSVRNLASEIIYNQTSLTDLEKTVTALILRLKINATHQ
jgi:hypothetical protein